MIDPCIATIVIAIGGSAIVWVITNCNDAHKVPPHLETCPTCRCEPGGADQ